jgi:hypothetical protein
MRQATPTTTADAAAVGSRKSGQNQSGHAWPNWALRLIGSLDGIAGNGLPHGFFLTCLAPNHVASLAQVALDAPADTFSGDQIKMLISRYKKRNQK